MELISIEAASKMMDIPVQWALGMIEKGEIEVVDSPNGVMIDSDYIASNGLSSQNAQGAVSYGHVNELMVNLGLRVLH